MVKLLACNPSGVRAMSAVDGKASNVIICDVVISIRRQVGHSSPNNVLQRNIKHVHFTPPGNPDELNLGGQDFVKAIGYVEFHVFGDNTTKRKHSMGDGQGLLVGKERQAHKARRESGKTKWLQPENIQSTRFEE